MKKLRDYQKSGIKWSLKKRYFALFWEMRLGKTLTTIRRIKLLPRNSLILVVAPFSVLYGWADSLKDENEQFLLPDINPCSKRIELIKQHLNHSKRQWFLLNKEVWKWFPDLANIPFTAVIIDESVILKTPSSNKKIKDELGKTIGRKRTGNISYYFTENFREVPYRIILSGLPAPESPLDYYMQIRFLHHDILDKTYWDFRAKRFRNTFGYTWALTASGHTYLRQKLAPICSVLTRKDVKLNDEKIFEIEYVELPAATRKTYNTILKEYILEHEGKIQDQTIFATTVYLWLRRICSGFVEEKLVSRHKIEAIKDLVQNRLSAQPVVIWSQYRCEIDALEKIFPKSAVIHGDVKPDEREKIRVNFQRNLYPQLIIQPSTFKYGMCLTTANTMIYFSTPDGLDTRKQTEDRTLDVSSSTGALIIDMVCKNTLEENILSGLKKQFTRSQIIQEFINGFKI